VASKGSNPPGGESVWRSIAWQVARLEESPWTQVERQLSSGALFREFLGAYLVPWPIGDFDYPDVALDTAMNYLECTGQAEKFVAVRRVAATAIATGA
jgi:hypothetical protein